MADSSSKTSDVRSTRLQEAVIRFMTPYFVDDPAGFITLLTRADRPEVMRWVQGDNIHSAYLDNSLGAYQPTLFKRDVGGYLQLSEAGTTLVKSLRLELHSGRTYILDLYKASDESSFPPGVELFVSGNGVVLASATFELSVKQNGQPRPPTLNELREVASRVHYGQVTGWSGASQAPVPLLLNTLPEGEAHSAIAEYGFPLSKSQSLQSLLRVFLAVLDANRLEVLQRSFATVSIAKFGSDAGWADPPSDEWSRELIALGSHMPVDHPGPTVAEAKREVVDVNRNHLACVGHLGAAHFVLDQPAGQPGASFNRQRVARTATTYFMPQLVALFQRLTIMRLGNDARMDVNNSEGVRRKLLKFGLQGQFSQIQVSDAGHEFYRAARRGLEVQTDWDHLHDTLSSIDAQQQQLAQNDLMKQLVTVQRKVEWVEIFLVAVYSLEVFHLVAYYALKLAPEPTSPDWYGLVYGGAYFFIALMAFAVGYAAVDPEKHSESADCRDDNSNQKSAEPADGHDHGSKVADRSVLAFLRRLLHGLRRELQAPLVFSTVMVAFVLVLLWMFKHGGTVTTAAERKTATGGATTAAPANTQPAPAGTDVEH